LGQAMFCQNFDIGGNCLRLVTNSQAILEEISQRLEPFTCPRAERAMKIYLFSVGTALPVVVPQGAQHIRSGLTAEHFVYKGLWLIDFRGRGRMVVDREGGTALGFIKSHHLQEKPWLSDVMVHPVFELLRQRGLYLAHSGAVSFDGKGLLVCGESRSGKTTLVVHLVREGLNFLSDDRCFLRRTASEFEVLSFPEEVNVYPGNVADLREFQFLQDDGHNNDGRKSFDIREVYPDSVMNRAEIKAAVFPCWDAGGMSWLEAIPSGEAMKEMIPLTLEAFFPDTARAHFEFIGDLVQRIPCFKLYLGSDKGKWHHLVEKLIR